MKSNDKDYYKILGVDSTVSQDEIKRAYRRLIIESHLLGHPDDEDWGKRRHRNWDVEAAEKRFRDIREAYDILGDPRKRQRYDKYGSEADYSDIPPVEPVVITSFPGPNATDDQKNTKER